MEKTRFKEEVKLYSSKEDYSVNKHLLEHVTDYPAFIMLLKFGCNIAGAFNSKKLLEEITIETALDSAQVLSLVSKLSLLREIMDTKEVIDFDAGKSWLKSLLEA